MSRYGRRHNESDYYNPMADNRTPEQKRIEELQLGAYNELRYWHHLQVKREVSLDKIKADMGLTEHGYLQFLEGVLHPMSVGNAVARTRAWELRYNDGYGVFVKGLKQ
ncbi:MAG: hypothetical protein RR740_00710 [Pseudomonas sp.]